MSDNRDNFPPDVWRFGTEIAGLPIEEGYGMSWNDDVVHLHWGENVEAHLVRTQSMGIPVVQYMRSRDDLPDLITGIVFHWDDVRRMLRTR